MPFKRDHSKRLIGFARRMRKEPTDAEKRLWSLLRDRQLNGFKFRRQVPIAGYVADFLCMDAMTVIEADGGQHLDSIEYDRKRSEKFTSLGFRVLRFPDDEILKYPDEVASAILECLEQQKSKSPHPYPLPEYRERE